MISCSCSLLAVDLGVDQHARQVVGRVSAPLLDQQPAALEDLWQVQLAGALDALGVQVRVARAEQRVHQLRPRLIVGLRDAHEAPDHPGDDRLGDVARPGRSARGPRSRSSTRVTIARISVLVRGDPLRGEAALEERLDAIVLGRVHADEHRPRELERDHQVGGGDSAQFRGVGPPVVADRRDVLGARYRPEPGLLREFAQSPRSSARGSCGASRASARAEGRRASSRARSASSGLLSTDSTHLMPPRCSAPRCVILLAPAGGRKATRRWSAAVRLAPTSSSSTRACRRSARRSAAIRSPRGGSLGCRSPAAPTATAPIAIAPAARAPAETAPNP